VIIKPRYKGIICTTAHPAGCDFDVRQQIGHVRACGEIRRGPKRVLVIGASGGYGLASRITATFGSAASTIGVFLERPSLKGRTASAGWYRAVSFDQYACEAGVYAKSLNGDAYASEMKELVVETIRADLGKMDMVVYSLASPVRVLPTSGEVLRSTLKPIGRTFSGHTIDIGSGVLRKITAEAATEREISDTVSVMGGEDWELWIKALLDADVLAKGCITTNYTYLGSEETWPIYHHGTIGRAKQDLDRAARALGSTMAAIDGTARVIVLKGLLTGASSAIPGMPLYLSLLFKVMKEKGIHEGCIEQIARLFGTRLFTDEVGYLAHDEQIRMDDLEMRADVQEYIKHFWSRVNQDNLSDLVDLEGYREAFLNLHGFAFDGVDYDADVEPIVPNSFLELKSSPGGSDSKH
jgi:enoyl-[acyl-carrier protein] reductase/trans-2-enoyl-CoA reductase (NAD+)